MESPPYFLIFLLLFFFYASPDTTQQTPSYRKERESRIIQEEHALDSLRNASQGDFDPSNGKYLPFVGMRPADGYAWDTLPLAQDTARKQLKAIVDHSGLADPAGDSDLDANFRKQLPVYQNLTGSIRGDWVRVKLPPNVGGSDVNLTNLVPDDPYVTHEFGRNITGDDGKISISLSEKYGEELLGEDGTIREIKADMIIHTGTTTGAGTSFTLHGVHFPEYGRIILTTTSEKFSGIFSLPHLTLGPHDFETTKSLLNRSITDTILKQKDVSSLVSSSPWSSSSNDANNALFPTPSCEHVVWLQSHPVVFAGSRVETPAFLQAIEDELRWPQGAPMPEVPPMVLSAVVFSPDCGFILESKGPPDFPPSESLHLSGIKLESYTRFFKRFMLAFCVIVGMQISLLMKQVKEASTPSTQSRISIYSIGIMATGDGVFFLAFLTFSALSSSNYLILTCAGFLTFFGVGFLGMKFLLDIWTVQAPERREREREAQQREQQQRPPTAAVAQATVTTLPLPATAPRARPIDTGATPIILPSDQDLDAAEAEDAAAATATTTQTTTRSAQADTHILYARFYFQLCAISLLTISSYYWPEPLRSIYVNTLSFTYLSFWSPQIFRNVMRNCRKALRWDFVIGQSILRLTPFMYFYCIPGNVLFITPDLTAAAVLAGWVWLQVWALASQELLGPRFFIRDGWAPPAYDYHPILRDSGSDLESGSTMPIGFIKSDQSSTSPTSPTDSSATTATTKDKPSSSNSDHDTNTNTNKRSFDCAICMQTIEVPIISDAGRTDGSNIATSILGRRTYMVTPCRHIFHSVCLAAWMRLRLQCPICRESLPPL